MPKKKGGKKKKKGKVKMVGNETPEMVVKRLHKTYERNCLMAGSAVASSLHRNLKDCIESNDLLAKFIIEPNPGIRTAQDQPILLEPLMLALRQERYVFIQDLHIWDVPLTHEQMASLALVLEKIKYPFRLLEFMDCLIGAYSLQRVAMTFNFCPTLTHIVLDYNEFGEEGVKGLCLGLVDNKTIIHLSLCYCGLGVESGAILGHIVSTGPVRELFVDGNDLQCDGAMEIIRLCVDQAQEETYQREEEKRRKEEEAAEEAARLEKESRQYRYSDNEAEKSRLGSAASTDKKKKKKGKKKKKSKEPPPPPRIGPWIHKLHLADNGIDSLGTQSAYAPLHCMKLFRKLMVNSDCLEELDLEDNLIGDLGGREILEALEEREEVGLPSMKVRTTHRMTTDTFNSIIKLGAGLKKKKKKKGKKKKK